MEIKLNCLVQFNMFRTWPMTEETASGALDKESIAVYLNNAYLKSLGYLSNEGTFKFDPGVDFFKYRGQKYRSSGETPAAQAHDEPLFTLLILKRTVTTSGRDKY